EEEITKLEYERKTSFLQRQETGYHDLLRTEEARANIESLESNLSYLQHSIGKTCLTILKLRDEELHPQLVELSSRLMRMWRKMYECHQVQNNISQQVNRLSEYPSTEPTTAFHCLSTTQLEREINIWCNSFCNLVKSQREYKRVLNRWVQLAECLADDQPQIALASNIHILCQEWQLAFDRLPEKKLRLVIKYQLVYPIRKYKKRNSTIIYTIHSIASAYNFPVDVRGNGFLHNRKTFGILNLQTRITNQFFVFFLSLLLDCLA
ncbi:hypothetical protein MKW94_008900, partial [Papaver nudicaule]|nr:hypothetical protein [Papaver nudicaule]